MPAASLSCVLQAAERVTVNDCIQIVNSLSVKERDEDRGRMDDTRLQGYFNGRAVDFRALEDALKMVARRAPDSETVLVSAAKGHEEFDFGLGQ